VVRFRLAVLPPVVVVVVDGLVARGARLRVGGGAAAEAEEGRVKANENDPTCARGGSFGGAGTDAVVASSLSAFSPPSASSMSVFAFFCFFAVVPFVFVVFVVAVVVDDVAVIAVDGTGRAGGVVGGGAGDTAVVLVAVMVVVGASESHRSNKRFCPCARSLFARSACNAYPAFQHSQSAHHNPHMCDGSVERREGRLYGVVLAEEAVVRHVLAQHAQMPRLALQNTATAAATAAAARTPGRL
jgi:hypothetical protein